MAPRVRQLLLWCAAQHLIAATADWSIGDAGIDHHFGIDAFNVSLPSNSSVDCAAACEAASAVCQAWVFTPSGPCGGDAAVCMLKALPGPPTPNACRVSGFPRSASLLPPAFSTLPLGSIVPEGWLAAELTVMANGLTGYLAEFWHDIMNSTFVGGGGDPGLHEKVPYWLNGLVPLSYLLPSQPRLAAQRQHFLEYIMEHQAASGWLGPDDAPTDGQQFWARYNLVLALEQYYEASRDPAAVTCIFRYLAEARRRMLSTAPLAGWSTSRAQDLIWSLQWLMDQLDTLQGVPPGYGEAFLLDMMDVVRGQAMASPGDWTHGAGDWKTFFDVAGQMPEGPACVNGSRCGPYTHGVNVGHAIKESAVWWRRSGDPTDVLSAHVRMQRLDAFHGVPSGMFQADEQLAGRVPSHGTETCAVTESVVSYNVVGDITGDAVFLERAERIAFNALPAATTKDQWERVYLQASNQFTAGHQDPWPWWTDQADAGAYSLSGNGECCTANMHAGWPKHTQRAIGVPSQGGGIAVLQWLPLAASTPEGHAVRIVTDFPFSDTVNVTVTPAAAATSPVPVQLRIPSWAARGILSVNGGPPVSLAASNGTFLALSAAPGAPTSYALDFRPSIRLEPYDNGTVAVVRGALVYSVWVGQVISVTNTYPFNAKDLSINATQPWNVALVVPDASNPEASLSFSRLGAPSSVPFNSTAVPVAITGMGRVVPSWGAALNAPAAPPASPACAAPSADCGQPTPITLVPMGSTHVRMTVIPLA